MKPYPIELRERVARAVDQHQDSLARIAALFSVSVSFITRLLQRRRQTGSLQPKPHGGGRSPAVDASGGQRLAQRLREQPDATLHELRQSLGFSGSLMAIWRALKRLKITRKKKTLRAQERDRPEVQAKRQAFQTKVAGFDPNRLVFVDESGATTAMTRTYGRAPQGERVYGSVPGSWKTVTLISAVRLSGVTASLVFPGATDTQAFRTYVDKVLSPQLGEGDVVIWDNLTPHKDRSVLAAVAGTGAQVEPAPPWSPDLLPIEKMWSKVKQGLRSLAARTTETVYQAVGKALKAVCPQDILGWFQSCGLCATQT